MDEEVEIGEKGTREEESAETLRERILNSNPWIDLDCPDSGQITGLKELSTNATCRFEENIKQPDIAFFRMLVALLKQDFEKQDFSENDLDYLAFHYINSLERPNGYAKARSEGNSPVEAFHEAFITSDYFRTTRKTLEKMETFLNPTLKLPLVDLGLHRHVLRPVGISTAVGAMKTISSTSALANSLHTYKSQIESLVDVSRLADMPQLRVELSPTDHLFQPSVIEGFIQSSSLLRAQASEILVAYSSATPLLLSGLKALDSLAPRIQEITSIALPAIDVRRDFAILMEEFTRTSDFTLTSFRHLDSVLSDSVRVVHKASTYFLRESRFIPHFSGSQFLDSMVEPQIAEDIQRREEEILEEVELFEEGLHRESGDVVRVGNYLVNRVEEVVEQKFTQMIAPFSALIARMDALTQRRTFGSALHRFAAGVAQDDWRVFWLRPGDKFITRPEGLAKSLLANFLRGAFGDFAFVGPEIASGNGFVDLLVHFLGMDCIVELKLVGASWGIGWVESGIPQLNTYMASRNVNRSYLIVLDGRKTEGGKQLQDQYDQEHGTVNIVRAKIFWPETTTGKIQKK